jgi:putative transposase
MARLPRIDLAGIPQHLIQRGNNRSACFFADANYAFYLECLRKAAAKEEKQGASSFKRV